MSQLVLITSHTIICSLQVNRMRQEGDKIKWTISFTIQ